MTAKELKVALSELGWSQAKLALRVDIFASTVSRWMQSPDDDIPGPVAAYVELALKVKELGREI